MSTLTQDDLIGMVKEITEEVFSTMLGASVQCGAAHLGKPKTASHGVVSFVGIAGPWAGMGSISCSAASACKLSGHLMMAEYGAVDEEVLDAIAELTNMIIGNVKTKLEDKLGSMGLSIPTVVYGRNFTSRTLRQQDWIIVPFDCGEEHFEVQLCLVPQEQAKPKVAQFAFAETVEL